MIHYKLQLCVRDVCKSTETISRAHSVVRRTSQVTHNTAAKITEMPSLITELNLLSQNYSGAPNTFPRAQNWLNHFLQHDGNGSKKRQKDYCRGLNFTSWCTKNRARRTYVPRRSVSKAQWLVQEIADCLMKSIIPINETDDGKISIAGNNNHTNVFRLQRQSKN